MFGQGRNGRCKVFLWYLSILSTYRNLFSFLTFPCPSTSVDFFFGVSTIWQFFPYILHSSIKWSHSWYNRLNKYASQLCIQLIPKRTIIILSTDCYIKWEIFACDTRCFFIFNINNSRWFGTCFCCFVVHRDTQQMLLFIKFVCLHLIL